MMMEGAKTQSRIRPQNTAESDYISYDAPPLDFSFKNIVQLSDLKEIEPRQGNKKQVAEEESKIKVVGKDEKEEPEHEAQGQHREKRKHEAIKLLPESKVGELVSSMVTSSAMKNISSKAKEQLQKKKKKAVHVKLVCASVMLGYNKIRQLAGFDVIIESIMESPASLQWVDLSHNYITTLDYDFQHFPHLKTLYLHCNYLVDLAQLEKLRHLTELKTATVHGNPLAAVPNFRILTISILSGLKKLDSVLISKKERDNAVFIRSQTKKYPLPKNPARPPVEKKEQEEEQDKE